ncbi:hypothetical protein CY652_06945 [Burkholderia sp. WAC0059]|uniref:Stf0 family sulfotransferase n=1 Tax=Burkholderia sp. WAC0059 TaxID=2066022 RepID=UPI000C7EB76F|nr:Stf0 family sulfotransferase [Burkholderia sp. WAC0059]PLZ03042.1 hypothetical protein CY652_06945 [Burkholderia sp. WAC0059]
MYLWREDVLAQSISYQLSIETGVWHNFSNLSHDEGFRYIPREYFIDKINFLLRMEKFFLEFFQNHGIDPYKLSYEEFIANPVDHAHRIAQHIGIIDCNFDIVNEGKVALRPTAKARNSYYKTLVITGGGDLWGYDIHERDSQYIAVLHGVDLSLLDTTTDRTPVLFLSNSREELSDNVNAYVMRHLSSLPSISTSFIPMT